MGWPADSNRCHALSIRPKFFRLAARVVVFEDLETMRGGPLEKLGQGRPLTIRRQRKFRNLGDSAPPVSAYSFGERGAWSNRLRVVRRFSSRDT